MQRVGLLTFRVDVTVHGWRKLSCAGREEFSLESDPLNVGNSDLWQSMYRFVMLHKNCGACRMMISKRDTWRWGVSHLRPLDSLDLMF